MYLLSVAFGPTVVGFMFKTKEAAESCLMNTLRDDVHVIVDDFGSSAQIKKNSMYGWILEDLNQSKLARAEQMVHQNRCQNLAAKIATSDPSLRNQGSPAVITPNMGGPNGFR